MKKYFAHYRCAINTYEAIINHIFGRHNLTSDAEGEEMLTVPRKKVQEMWQRAYKQESQYSRTQDSSVAREELYYNRGIMSIIDTLFGSKCLPDDTKDDTKTKPAEPKFTKGDMVHCKSFGYEGDYKVLEYTGGPRNCYDCIDKYGAYYRFYDSDLEPYTEPEEDKAEEIANKAIEPMEKHFDNILKDSFRNERRLNIAAMAMQGILSNPQLLKIVIETYREEIGSPDTYVAVAKAAKEQADALIDECEKRSSDEKD